MTMILDTTHKRFGPSFHFALSTPPQPPVFSSLWPSSSSRPQPAPAGGGHLARNHQALVPSMIAGKPPHSGQYSTISASSTASYNSMLVANTSADLLSTNRIRTTPAAYGGQKNTTWASPVSAQVTRTSITPYEAMPCAPAPVRPSPITFAPDADHARRFPQQGLQSNVQRSFVYALDVSQGMPDICQETPRDGYGSRSDRSSVDRYGFPSAHSTSSSIPSTYNFSSYGGSVSDPSTASSDVKPVNLRALLQPQGLMASEVPPTPQSLMGQFRSKVSSRPQKKHKCKVCDKLFTRPSSLQTHVYSHTGERPFACEVEGCGRNFSVVSNLRRHRKVHRGDTRSEVSSEDYLSI
ncbi:Hypothetical protein NCS54_01481900 [Fusarium falciforme]|uniref:Hypothetical protein n=1 Tax=Fusarium falciforme TaxID=195108 RepID=UPI0023010A32|nr:Hypothetical protein NCS54_01481900 [Fusarium falciforme]WAO97110.1 Hypothetical protein NCS54_01481900 [Fusarium falciforme]